MINGWRFALLTSVFLASCVAGDDELPLNARSMDIRDPTLVAPGNLAGVVNIEAIGSDDGPCPGMVIAKDTILTAAHCVCTDDIVGGNDCQGQATVRFRSPSTGNLGAPMTGNVAVHPGYDPGPQGFDGDLALVVLPAGSTPSYATPFIVADTYEPAGASIMVAGFGRTGSGCESDNNDFTILNFDMTVIENYYSIIEPNPDFISLDPSPLCKGDSGGPVLQVNGTLSPYHLLGVHSTEQTFLDERNLSTATARHFAWLSSVAALIPDLRTDILWHNVSGEVKAWVMTGAEPTDYVEPTTVPGIDWQIHGTGDFNADRLSDILWRNSGGEVKIWFMNGTDAPVQSTVLNQGAPLMPGPEWNISRTGDFNGDRKTDILWRNVNGEVKIWLMNGYNITAQPSQGSQSYSLWFVEGTGDFDVDGKTDIVWRNTSTGAVRVWFMNGGAVANSIVLATVPGPEWQIKGIGDFNDDEKSDILWKNANGEVKIWFFNGTRSSGAASTQQPATWLGQIVFVTNDWQIRGVGDFDGDGRSDILWRNNDFTIRVWLMNGSVILSTPTSTVTPGAEWNIRGTGRFL